MELLDFLSLFYSDPKSYLMILILIGLYKHDRSINQLMGYFQLGRK